MIHQHDGAHARPRAQNSKRKDDRALPLFVAESNEWLDRPDLPLGGTPAD